MAVNGGHEKVEFDEILLQFEIKLNFWLEPEFDWNFQFKIKLQFSNDVTQLQLGCEIFSAIIIDHLRQALFLKLLAKKITIRVNFI